MVETLQSLTLLSYEVEYRYPRSSCILLVDSDLKVGRLPT